MSSPLSKARKQQKDFKVSSVLFHSTRKPKGDRTGAPGFFEKKSHSTEKSRKGDPLVSSGIVCYAKKGATISSVQTISSLGQMVQFGP